MDALALVISAWLLSAPGILVFGGLGRTSRVCALAAVLCAVGFGLGTLALFSVGLAWLVKAALAFGPGA